LAAFFPGDKLGTPASYIERSGSRLVPGGGSDHQRLEQYDQRPSLQLAAELVGLDPYRSSAADRWAGGALELDSGQSATQDLGPFNVNNQQIRRRFWDGHDQMLRDDISTLKGNHCSSLAVPISTTGITINVTTVVAPSTPSPCIL